MDWFVLVASLSGKQGALRLRLWRSLKAIGAAALRDGVYLVPAQPALRSALEEQRAAVIESGGASHILNVTNVAAEDEAAFIALFDRGDEYAEFVRGVRAFVRKLPSMSESEARRSLQGLRREFGSIERTDIFPGRSRVRADEALRSAEVSLDRIFSPEEPIAAHLGISVRDAHEFQGRLWATRQFLWVDRVCSAWLIQRFIDPAATFVWLAHAADCPSAAVGFDFDGAEFTHVDAFVTFEALVRSFRLERDGALMRIGALVHDLDVGRGECAEAPGFEAILAGARERCADDDELLEHVSVVLDDMYRAFLRETAV